MKTVGYILRNERQKKRITIERVEHDTKIRKKFLLAIENDDMSSLPSVSYAKGFIRNYSAYLGLDSSTVMAFFRRQSKDVNKLALLPKDTDRELKISNLRLTPKRFLFLMVMALLSILVLYFGFQYWRLQTPPYLSIQSPEEGYVSNEKLIKVSGRTDPDATLTINGVNSILDSSGKFFDQIGLQEGMNQINITATSRYGRKVSADRSVIYQPNTEP